MKCVNREESTTTPFETLHQRTSHAQDAAKVQPVIRREHCKSVVGDRMDVSYYKSASRFWCFTSLSVRRQQSRRRRLYDVACTASERAVCKHDVSVSVASRDD